MPTMREAVLSENTIEDVRAYWDARPCNVRHGQSPVGTLEWSQQVTGRKYFVEAHIPRFAQFDRWRKKSVLEIGCGIGTNALSFAKAGAFVTGIDVSIRSIELAEKRKNLEHIDALPLFLSWEDAEKFLPSVSEGFDLIYSFGVLHHTPRPDKILRRAWERLRDDGELRIMLYAKWSLKNLLARAARSAGGMPNRAMVHGEERDETSRRLRIQGREHREDAYIPVARGGLRGASLRQAACRIASCRDGCLRRWRKSWGIICFSWLGRREDGMARSFRNSEARFDREQASISRDVERN